MKTPARTFRSLFLLLPLFLPAWLAVGILDAAAQVRPGLRIESTGSDEALDQAFETLDPARIPSGLLHDRVISFVDVTRFDGTAGAARATLDGWRQMYHELSRGGVGPAARPHPRGGRTVPGLPPMEAVNRAAARYLREGLVPLAVMSIRYDKVKPEALARGLLRVQGDRLYDGPPAAASPYEARLAFAAAAYTGRSSSREVRFVVAPELYLTHGTPRPGHVSVDFGDGRGLQRVRIGAVVPVRYATGGLKEITLVAGGEQQPLYATTALSVTEVPIPDPDLSWLNQTAGRAYAGAVASYDAHFFFGAGNTSPTRPVVFVEGFDPNYTDPARRRTWQDMYEVLSQQDFGDRLRVLGYDVVLMKLSNATDYVQRNAFALEHLLGRLRTELPPGAQTVVVGPSMGGLIGRYALAFMEQNAIPHNVRLYVAADTPHQGSNLPLGVQHFCEFFNNDSQKAQQCKDALNSPAGRQMLFYQYRTFPDEDALRTTFMGELGALGYPATRNISITNGSGYGRPQRGNERVGFRDMMPGDKIIAYRYRSLFIDLDGDVWAVPDISPETQIFEGLKNVIGPHYRALDVYVSGTLPYDNAPGGLRGTQAEIADSEVPYGDIRTSFPDHAFIPTTSGLDLNTTDLFYDVSADPAGLTTDYVHGKQSTADYDAIFFPLDNEEHVEATEENTRFLLGEIDTVYPASRTVAEDRTFNSGQQIALADGITLTFDGAVRIAPGVRFALGRDARIVFNGPVQASGTPNAPVAFERSGPDAWKWLALNADGNLFEYVHFDGGNKTVEVRSKHNVFRNCRFENGWRGISSYYAVSGGRSSFSLEQSIVRNNRSVGVVAYHADADFVRTTIQGNGQSGVWLYDADVDLFYQSVVEGNATIAKTRSGVEVVGGSYVWFFGPDAGRGRTRIAGNTYHEVYVSFSAAGAMLGLFGYGGYNSVFDGNEGSTGNAELLLWNRSSATVYAHRTYWGGYVPGVGDLSGPVHLHAVLFQDPTLPPRPAPLASGSADGDARRLGERMREIRDWLREHPFDGSNASLLRELHALQRLDPRDQLGEGVANRAALAQWRDGLRRRDRAQGRDDQARWAAQQAGEAALLLEIREALLGERYDVAARLVRDYGGFIEGEDNRRMLLLEQVALLEHEGRFAEALARLEKFSTDAALRSGDDPGLYDIVRETLRERLQEQGGVASKASLARATAPHDAAPLRVAQEAFTMGPAYPNPFNPTTTIPFHVAAAADVRMEVYDVMGRRVAVLADGPYAAGVHYVTFAADALASGLYLVRASVATGESGVRVFSQRLSLLK